MDDRLPPSNARVSFPPAPPLKMICRGVFSSMPVEAPEAKCVVVNGVAKTYAMTGWRVGWMIAPQEVAAGATRLQSHMTSNVNNIAQRAAIEAVSGPLDAVADMRSAFDRRRRTMHRMLNQSHKERSMPSRISMACSVVSSPADV